MTSITTTADRLATLVYEPRIERLRPVEGRCLQLSAETLAEAAHVIAENPELAREMGCTTEDTK